MNKIVSILLVAGVVGLSVSVLVSAWWIYLMKNYVEGYLEGLTNTLLRKLQTHKHFKNKP